MELYWRTMRQRDERIAAEQRAAEQAAAERRAAQQAAAEAEQRRLAAEANVRELQRARERAERDAPGGVDLMAQSNDYDELQRLLGPGADIGRAPLEASAQRPPTATYRGMAAADPDEAGEARYNACSAALSEALPDP